jgi:hypothetical protein
MTTSLKNAWALWEKAEKGWESGKPEGKKTEVYTAPEPTKEKKYEKPVRTDAQKDTPSGLNTLENGKEYVPGKDKDAKVMQLKTELAKLEEALMDMEIEEAFMTPDIGTSTQGLGVMAGTAVEPAGTYDRNFCPDPPAPEESGNVPQQDPSDALVAQKQFIPREDRALAEHIAWNQRVRRQKIEG